MPKRVRRGLVGSVASLVATMVMMPAAHADGPSFKLAWIKTVEDAQAWLGASASASRSGAAGAPGLTLPGLAIPGLAPPAAPPTAPETGVFAGTTPHLSLVGRDWNESFLLSGRLSALDAFHLSRDSRMVVARVGVGDGVVVPFVQAGVGQWRVDTNWLPRWVCDTEVATQVGAGLELRVHGAYSIALEGEYTVLFREQALPTNVPFPRMWGALSAARLRF
jgi:hypothetical protein